MTKEEWRSIRQAVNDIVGYAKDAGGCLRGNPNEDKAQVALRRLRGARVALDIAEEWLHVYLASRDQGELSCSRQEM